MLMWVLTLEAVAVVAIALLGNEFRLIIDEHHNDRAERSGRHMSGVAGTITAHALARRDQAAQDRLLFERVAQDFHLAEMNWHTEPLPTIPLPAVNVEAQMLVALSKVGE